MIRGVIFDVDGVLLNSMPVWENLGELYLKGRGIAAEKGLGEKLFTMSLEEGAQYLISHYNLEMTCEQVVKGLAREVREFYAERVPLKEGARQFIEEFRERKIPMAIATSGDRENTEAALKRLKIYLIFREYLPVPVSEAGKISRIFIMQQPFSWIQTQRRRWCLKMHIMPFGRQKKRGLKQLQYMTGLMIKIWHISGIWRIFICRNLQTLICSGKG